MNTIREFALSLGVEINIVRTALSALHIHKRRHAPFTDAQIQMITEHLENRTDKRFCTKEWKIYDYALVKEQGRKALDQGQSIHSNPYFGKQENSKPTRIFEDGTTVG